MEKCQCCGEETLEEGNGNYEICSCCFWEDDPVQNYDIYLRGGANNLTIVEHREVFQTAKSVFEYMSKKPAEKMTSAQFLLDAERKIKDIE